MVPLDASSILAGDVSSTSCPVVVPGQSPARAQHRASSKRDLSTQTIMIVDDALSVIVMVQKYLREAGFSRFLTTTDATQALSMISEGAPDVILLDIQMPHVSGLEILESVRADENLVGLPVIILTSTTDSQVKSQALELGATDFLAKPFDPHDLVPRVRNALVLKAQFDHLANHADELEHQVRERTSALRLAEKEVIECLAQASEFRDNDTGHHVIRVGLYAAIIARELGWGDDEVELIQQAAQLHDVGKIGIPDSILLKPGKLDPGEFDIIRTHCEIGKGICDKHSLHPDPLVRSHVGVGAMIMGGKISPILKLAASIAFTHHEKWDGTGYPLGLTVENIPIEGRITAVSDVFDALSNKRPYKPAFPIEQCFDILKESRGTHFDPAVLDAFFACTDQILRTRKEYADVL